MKLLERLYDKLRELVEDMFGKFQISPALQYIHTQFARKSFHI